MRSPAASRADRASDQAGRPPLIVICGATATGKTGLSLAIAERLGAVEVVSADSRQVYRGMDIGTAKVERAARDRIIHHGLDLVDPDQSFTVADFAQHAGTALDGIAARRRVAILVGGSGLYLRAVARGMPITETGRDPDLRTQLEERLAEEGLPSLVADLRATAPGMARMIDLANPRRVVRALERAAMHGDTMPPRPSGYPGPAIWLGLADEPGPHRARIAERARGQFVNGLLDEAASLRGRYPTSMPAFSAIGYREAFAALDARMTVAQAADVAASRTWAYARRQRTWFRREPDVSWLPAADAASADAAIELVRPLLGRT